MVIFFISLITVSFFIIAILILLIIFCKLTFGLTVNIDNLDCNVFVTIYFLGDKIKKSIKIYPRKKKGKNIKKTKKLKHKLDLTKLKVNYPDILKILKAFKKGLIIKEFKCYIKEGTGDAFNTAILYGLLWNLFGLLQTVVMNQFIVEKKEIRIEAEFMEKIWKLNFDCIFSIRVVNIILMCKELLRYYLKNRKGGDADVRPSNRRFNDYSNAKY